MKHTTLMALGALAVATAPEIDRALAVEQV